MTPEQTQILLAALRRELDGYKARGMHARVTQVEVAIAALAGKKIEKVAEAASGAKVETAAKRKAKPRG